MRGMPAKHQLDKLPLEDFKEQLKDVSNSFGRVSGFSARKQTRVHAVKGKIVITPRTS